MVLTFPAADLVIAFLPYTDGSGCPPLPCLFPAHTGLSNLGFSRGQATLEPLGAPEPELKSLSSQNYLLQKPCPCLPAPGHEDPRKPPGNDQQPWQAQAHGLLPAPTTHVIGHC